MCYLSNQVKAFTRQQSHIENLTAGKLNGMNVSYSSVSDFSSRTTAATTASSEWQSRNKQWMTWNNKRVSFPCWSLLSSPPYWIILQNLFSFPALAHLFPLFSAVLFVHILIAESKMKMSLFWKIIISNKYFLHWIIKINDTISQQVLYFKSTTNMYFKTQKHCLPFCSIFVSFFK